MDTRGADYDNEPAPTLDEIIMAERDRESHIGWKIEYVPHYGYWKWLPMILPSYKSHPWGYRKGRSLRWLGFTLRLHGRFITW